MNDDYEERVRQDWYYTYKTWDAADARSPEAKLELESLLATSADVQIGLDRGGEIPYSDRIAALRPATGGAKAQRREDTERLPHCVTQSNGVIFEPTRYAL